MIDELTLLKEMLGDLTNAGIWGVCIFVGYKLILFTGTTASFVYIIKLVVTSIFKHVQSDFTKAQAADIKSECERKVSAAEQRTRDLLESTSTANRECNEVKSMYKILKQKHEAEDEQL